jgi:HK97 family phage major capsid protein
MGKFIKKAFMKMELQTFSATPEVRLAEIEARKSAIRTLLEGNGEVDLDALTAEVRALDEEKSKIEQRKAAAASINVGNPPPEARQVGAPLDVQPVIDPKAADKEVRKKRGEALKENRSVTVASTGVILPRHDANDIRPTFNQVSSLIDRVTTKPLIGGESYRQPYLKSYGTGDYTAEGVDYTTAEPVFDSVAINKSKVTAYAEDSEELQKLPAVDYDAEVMKGITVASRKKITREILIGDGTTNHLAGIFSAAATAIDAATDVGISAIDNNTLEEIVFGFGGDEDVEDAAVLILNKKDLRAFAKLRTTDGKKFHTIVTNGNTGTIDTVPFIINSACKPVSVAATTVGSFAMAYGPLSNYLLTVFSDIDVQRSTDYKFKQGMIAHRSAVFVGGNVASANGFLRVKKVAAV